MLSIETKLVNPYEMLEKFPKLDEKVEQILQSTGISLLLSSFLYLNLQKKSCHNFYYSEFTDKASCIIKSEK